MTKDDELLTQEQVAKWLNIKARTLRNWRDTGSGPVSIRLGRQVRYRRSDVSQWLEAQVEKRA
jgi:excisionase family DNA binding protein